MILKYDHKMTINEMRRLDLIDLRKRIGWHGSLIKIEKMAGIDAGYIGRCCLEEGKDNKRNIGNKLLDKLDAAFPGWRKREFVELEKHHQPAQEVQIEGVKEAYGDYEDQGLINKPLKTRNGVTKLQVKFSTIPVLSRAQVISREFLAETEKVTNWPDPLVPVSKLTFAVNSNIFKTEVERYGYEPDTIIFIDPEKKVENGKPVLVLDGNSTIFIRHIESVGNKIYLATKSPLYSPVELDESMLILGAIAGTAKVY